MINGLSLFLAACTACGPSQVPTGAGCGCGQAAAPMVVEVVPAQSYRPWAGLTLPERIRRRLAGQPLQSAVSCGCGCTGAPASAMVETAPPAYHAQAVPAPTLGETDELAEPTPAPAPRPSFPLAKQYEDRVGHEADYSWVTGHLFYVHTDGGKWVVRYALPDQVDKYGGSVVLAPAVEMKNFREGDLVCVFGHVLDDGRAVRSLGGALYRADSITMVERADQ
jgi:hypothetical protein